MSRLPFASANEEVVLGLLQEARELFGLELVRRSKGLLNRASVYLVLQRMEKKGFVTSRVEDVSEKQDGYVGMGRRFYGLTELGAKALEARLLLKGVS